MSCRKASVRTGSSTKNGAFVAKMGHSLSGVVSRIHGKVHGSEAKGAISSPNGGVGALLDTHARSDARNDARRVVTLTIVADHASE